MSAESDFLKLGRRMLEIDPNGEVVKSFSSALLKAAAPNNLRSILGRASSTGPQHQPL